MPPHVYLDDPDLSDEEDLDMKIEYLFDSMAVLVNALDREIGQEKVFENNDEEF